MAQWTRCDLDLVERIVEDLRAAELPAGAIPFQLTTGNGLGMGNQDRHAKRGCSPGGQAGRISGQKTPENRVARPVFRRRVGRLST